MSEAIRKVTVIYCCDDDLSLYKKTENFNLNSCGKMIIPHHFKSGKTIVALCEGDIDIINSEGNKLVNQF